MLVDFRALTSSCLKEDEENEFVRGQERCCEGCNGEGWWGNEGNVITPAAARQFDSERLCDLKRLRSFVCF